MANRINRSDFFLVFMLISVSGIPVFVGSRYILPAFYLLTLFLSFSRKIKFSKTFVFFTLITIVILVFQMLYFKHFAWFSSIAFVIKITLPFLILSLIRTSFMKTYVTIMYYIALSSLFLYFLFIAFPGFREFVITNISPFFHVPTRNHLHEFAPNILIYTFTKVTSFRNSGPFWEPGGYAVFLIIALLINFKLNPSFKNKQNLLFIVSLLSTFSTAGYVLLGLLIIYQNLKARTKNRYLYIPLILSLSFLSYFRLDFIGNKVSSRIQSATDANLETTARTRFVSALVDWEQIQKSPFIGVGRDAETRFGIKANQLTYTEHRNNGITGLASKFGLLFFFTYVYMVFLFFKRLEKNRFHAIIMTLFFFLIGFSQSIFEKPLLISFVYLHIFYYREQIFLLNEKNRLAGLLS
jgi:hypothetical protein